jgi:hypothetical protein
MASLMKKLLKAMRPVRDYVYQPDLDRIANESQEISNEKEYVNYWKGRVRLLEEGAELKLREREKQ